ncbi:MAG: hypothetical protein FWC93_07005, partial [Defluviitaleaceae bacterium]|nr:hypothetical protein [Defluviitaleaceae bacterium]
MKKLMVSGRLISLIFGFVLLGGLVAAVSASEKIIEDDNFTIMIQEFVGTTTKILHEHGEVTVHLATADSEIIMIYKNADGSGRFPKYLPMRLHFLRDDGSRTPGFAAYISQEEPAYKHPDFLNYDAWLLSSFTWANVMRSMFVILEIDGLFLLFVDNNDLIIVNPTESDIPAKSAKESVANESDLPVAPNLGTANQWAREYINQAFNSGLIPTSLQNNYTANITRAEFAALAVALYGAVTGNEISGRMMFNDTYDVNVQKMGALGVVQ